MTEAEWLHDRSKDVYYRPGAAHQITFGVRPANSTNEIGWGGTKPGAPFGNLQFRPITDNEDGDLTICDPDALAELRRWCEMHTGVW